MNYKYIAAVIIISMFVLGGYLVWLGGSTSGPVVASTSLPPGAAQPTINPNITIVPVALNSEGVPTRLSTLALTRTVTGTAALAEFSQLHGKGFDLAGGYMATYGKDEATLWVGQAKNADGANKLLDEMAQRIGPDNAMFKGLQSLSISGRTLYSATGQGQQHFFYAVNDKIVWLAAAPEVAPDILHSLWGMVK